MSTAVCFKRLWIFAQSMRYTISNIHAMKCMYENLPASDKLLKCFSFIFRMKTFHYHMICVTLSVATKNDSLLNCLANDVGRWRLSCQPKIGHSLWILLSETCCFIMFYYCKLISWKSKIRVFVLISIKKYTILGFSFTFHIYINWESHEIHRFLHDASLYPYHTKQKHMHGNR